MARSASTLSLGSEFDGFLRASIGEDRNGMPLNVLSLLARSGTDPWQEAAILARLSGAVATERLASLIAALPDEALEKRESGMIAARLIMLLPPPSKARAPWRNALFHGGSATDPWAMKYFFFYLIIMAFVLGIHGVVASRRPSAQGSRSHALSASTTALQHHRGNAINDAQTGREADGGGR